jgi:hypothetical protein
MGLEELALKCCGINSVLVGGDERRHVVAHRGRLPDLGHG